MSKSIFTDETVIVKYIPNYENGITDKMHPLYGGLSSNASILEVAPVLKGKIKDLFSTEEITALKKALKVDDLSPRSDFWKEYRTDANGVPTGIFPIALKKEGMFLSKKDPEDFIKIRVLEHSDIVANSKEEIKYRPKEYRFVMIKQNEEHKDEIKKISSKKEAFKLYMKFEDKPAVLRYILKTFNKNVAFNSNDDFLKKEAWKLVELMPSEFVNVVEDPLLESKILLDELVRYKLVNVANRLYYDAATGDPIKLDGDKNDYDGAAKFLDSGAGQEFKLNMQARLKDKNK